MIDEILKDTKTKMQKAVEATKDEFATIRTGRANAAMFDGIVVEYYGSPTPLKQLASFNIPEARTVIIQPFDRNATQDIIHAISESDLGVTPTDDGKTIRVVLPALTEDRRKEYVKQAKTKAEEGRVSIRGIRRKAKDAMEALKKDKTLGEDEVERGVKELDTVTKKFTDEVDTLLEDKETDLMTV
ncbi:ribosome recycling factor [Mobiluncus mulieris]|uniref:Ribosome-recycling factor n=1 Tax=Mobiluncus mulieris TaxID=2052 RepID=A0A8G2M4X3_9ACTO|nr:ribosome recycling factor [Mobiluncus mulieris]EEJ53658.1 ribosome recycling factor [Mobiluncus mulieris ATCC 35243]MBB5845592.1 ribosome recycling factor [Mobiluncus mulieris]MCU9971387.1 ribosome recycling factor [Mobiluncus mulieris]MCU9975865.1 ribosome recycling factor [Mobiluncus mulieris]MCV0002733.1 ribosome recycling factor [Mobiluncus mulieris]